MTNKKIKRKIHCFFMKIFIKQSFSSKNIKIILIAAMIKIKNPKCSDNIILIQKP